MLVRARSISFNSTRLAALPIFTLLGALTLAACDEVEVRPFPPGQGQDPNASGVAYPSGPYGVAVGNVISNYRFRGLANPALDAATFVDIQLADFYNPTGADSFTADSPYGERPKPRVLWLNLSAVWCGPCQQESEEILPEEHAKYAPQGAELLVLLADTALPGTPATEQNLISWTTKYETAWPAAIDPSYKLPSLFTGSAYPINMVIDTQTMEIVSIIAGIPDTGSKFYQELEALLEP